MKKTILVALLGILSLSASAQDFCGNRFNRRSQHTSFRERGRDFHNEGRPGGWANRDEMRDGRSRFRGDRNVNSQSPFQGQRNSNGQFQSNGYSNQNSQSQNNGYNNQGQMGQNNSNGGRSGGQGRGGNRR